MTPFDGPFSHIYDVGTNPRLFSLRQRVLLDNEMSPWHVLVVLMFVKRVWGHFQVSPTTTGKAVLERGKVGPILFYWRLGNNLWCITENRENWQIEWSHQPPGKAYIHLLYGDTEFLKLMKTTIILSLCISSQLAAVAVIVTSFARELWVARIYWTFKQQKRSFALIGSMMGPGQNDYCTSNSAGPLSNAYFSLEMSSIFFRNELV